MLSTQRNEPFHLDSEFFPAAFDAQFGLICISKVFVKTRLSPACRKRLPFAATKPFLKAAWRRTPPKVPNLSGYFHVLAGSGVFLGGLAWAIHCSFDAARILSIRLNYGSTVVSATPLPSYSSSRLKSLSA